MWLTEVVDLVAKGISDLWSKVDLAKKPVCVRGEGEERSKPSFFPK